MTNFEAMTDTEINEWAAKRDGWTHRLGKVGFFPWSKGALVLSEEEFQKHVAYATSADAVLGLAERWGL